MAGERAKQPDDVELHSPTMARMYDYALGGGHNLGSDRELMAQLQTIRPEIQRTVWHHRAFLRRAVLFMLESGVRQFLDLGSGIPTAGNVHEIVQKAEPAARVVYVDRDPLAVNQFHQLLEHNPRATIIGADVRWPNLTLNDPEAKRLLDLSEPIGVLALCVAHFMTDAEVDSALTGWREVMPIGSILAISHVTGDDPTTRVSEVLEAARKGGSEKLHARSKADVRRLFGDFSLVEPGLVAPSRWRPDHHPEPGANLEDDGAIWAGVATKA